MRKYFPLATGILALGTEALVFLSLMELPPFGKGGSDIIWALPFFGLIVVGLSTVGIRAAIRANSNPSHAGKVVVAGLFVNTLSLVIPILLLLFGVARTAFLS